MPSTPALAAGLGLSRGTVVAADEQLNAEGYLSSRPGLVIGYGAPPEHAWGASLNALGQLLAAELG